MKSKFTKFFWLVLFIISVGIFSSTQIQAASIPISVKPIIPENQIGDVTSFYQLKVKPEQKQDLEMELENSSEQAITVDLAINPASTGMSGSLIYNQGKSKKQHLAPVTLTDIASVEQHVEVPAKGKKKIKIHLEVPKEKFEGVVLGALRISGFDDKEEQPKEDTKAKSESFSVNNKYAYAIAIQLQEEDKINVNPEIKLDKVIASQIAGRNTIKAQLQNPTPVILNGLIYNVKVTSQKKDEVIFDKKIKDYRFAPSSTFTLPMDLGDARFVAGDCHAEIVAESKEFNKKWHLKQDFTITKDQAKKLNESSIAEEEGLPTYVIILLIVFGVITILAIIGMFYFKKQAKKKTKKRKKVRK